ncbi:auxin efflux carrier component 5-like isoform X1 [Salvia divinorum]|uniref:Auxin efflux carrier component n=1 Tax=Salvia divinorum TaxID=28513 RepID=A0ABD1FM00_SALDI
MQIGWGDVYKVVEAMAPLYVALLLGYGSRRMFKAEECDAINRFNCYFILPFFTFHFTASVNPYTFNLRFLAGDVLAKAVVGAALVLWCKAGFGFAWAITSFSLSSFNNTLVVGVPLLKAMYGDAGEHLVIQSSVIQSLLWFPILLSLLEFRRAQLLSSSSSSNIHADASVVAANGDHNCTIISTTASPSSSSSFCSTIKIVGMKLRKNPNCYACVLGLIWALLANRLDIVMPPIVEGSIQIMAKAGSGVAMFTMGLFMALQEKIIACGVGLSIYGMGLRFVCGPLITGVSALALGLRSDILAIVIIQAALPQSITCFMFAQEYSLHANVLSTAVIFGTIASLPVLIAYYVILDILVH